jgi:hypothetical protein
MLKGYVEREKSRRVLALAASWHTAVLAARAIFAPKKFPSLKELLAPLDEKGRSQPQSWQEQKRAMQIIGAQLDGVARG